MSATIFTGLENWLPSLSSNNWLLNLAWVALGLATVVLAFMFITGHGNARQVRISLMISIIAHCALALGTDKIPMAGADIRVKPKEPTFEIEQLVFTAIDDQQQVADPNAPAWDALTPTPLPATQRQSYEDATEELPEIAREEQSPQDPEPVALADVPDEMPEDQLEIPSAESSVPATERTADGTQLDNYEETVESRPDLDIPAPRTGERQPEDQGVAKSEIERESRRGRTEDPTANLRESQRMEVADATTDPSSQLQRGPNSEAANRRTADAAETLSADDPGAETAQRREEVGKGRPKSKAFTRRDNPGTTPSTPGLDDDVERNPRPESDDDPDSLLLTREGGPQPISEDAKLRLTRTKTTRSGDQRRVARLPATYQLRNVDNRERVAIRHGATTASEEAVEDSLQWLAAHQSAAGFWDANGFTENCPKGADVCWGLAGLKGHQGSEKDNVPKSGVQADSGLTGLAVLAFLGAGYTHEEGIYADQVDHALRWLIRQQDGDGFLGGNATHYAKMYCHGMATIALGEAYGMTQDPTLREPLEKAIAFIVARQNPKDGGWRYTPGKLGDVSMFGWQLMALKSAETAGLTFPAETRSLTINFLVSHSRGKKRGLSAYRLDDKVTPAMTAEALFCKQVLGIKRENSQSAAAVDYLMQHLPKQSEQNLYYWYYGTLAMFQYGGQPWEQWNERVRETLVETQRKDGHATGSWDPRPPWGDYGGRIYSTVLSTLCLEVYYRFLPMYRAGETE
ncbi:hypothetical protein CA54_52020 [Symmachiella macrocystis]|uniref:Squalene cyclase C-terminal domain-containing protein n=1 Tax=Symmachiella macrocystis TaxID=2527985 RepID=A0A5C6B3R8_9PLAN|nr:hypothetical protein [Symmachiella macrocystis]TWU06803.1 hypothetical protein CA54_52020 [Symmachiella macrocystis]